MSDLAIHLGSVSKRYLAGRRQIPAVRDLSVSVERGEFVAIVGPSGCGKSTLLNLITGIDHADEGRIEVFGEQLNRLSQDELAKWRGRHIGIVFQFFQLMPTLTALENILLPMDLAGIEHDTTTRGRQLLERVGLADLASNLPAELSGGEQQRIAIARALANQPDMLVADEPTGNLDSRTGAAVVELLRSVWRSGTTLVIVTHDLELAQQAPRQISMLDGQIIEDTRRVHHVEPVSADTNANASS